VDPENTGLENHSVAVYPKVHLGRHMVLISSHMVEPVYTLINWLTI